MGPSLQGKVCLVTGAARGIGRGEMIFIAGVSASGVSGSGVFDYWVSVDVSCHSLGESGIEVTVSASGVFEYWASAEVS